MGWEEWEKEEAVNIERIKKLQKEGHHRHCACRQVWGDGECECDLIKKGYDPYAWMNFYQKKHQQVVYSIKKEVKMKQEFVLKYFRDIIKEKGCIKTTEIVVAITCFLLENKEDYISPLQILKLLPSDEIKTVEYQIADLPERVETLFYYKANSKIIDTPKG